MRISVEDLLDLENLWGFQWIMHAARVGVAVASRVPLADEDEAIAQHHAEQILGSKITPALVRADAEIKARAALAAAPKLLELLARRARSKAHTPDQDRVFIEAALAGNKAGIAAARLNRITAILSSLEGSVGA